MIPIRALQHYLYCPHRWGMLYMNDAWSDNAFTVKADIMHQRVDGGGLLDSGKGIKKFGDITVYDEQLGIYGKADCLELSESGGATHVKIVEYKPTMPGNGPALSDRLQVYAQYRCVKRLFDGEISAYIYYSDVRRRVKIDFDSEDEELLLSTVGKIKEAIREEKIPLPVKSDKCNGCSLEDACMPRIRGRNVKAMILEENE